MRFKSVTAHSFGPLRGEMLPFAQNMTVVHGPNESGKSSWHAVLYAAFCGMRRGAGQRSADKEFTIQHKPWATDAWKVSTVLSLNDGRGIELQHDLAGKVDCCAMDEDLGRDVSDEVMNEGTPDGSMWLGLDRRSFLATACVKQTDLLSILEDPDLLQTHLQRAAATSGVDATAAAAISALDRFRKEQVGLARANSKKPLARALRRVEDAMAALEQARNLHDEFLKLSVRANDLRGQKEDATRKLRLTEAAVAARRAKEWEERLAEAEQLLAQHPAGPPVSRDEDDKLAQRIATAVGSWRERPELIKLEDPSSLELRERLEALPKMPEGDLKPQLKVSGARDAYLDAERMLDQHQGSRPLEPVWPETGGLSAEDLHNLARDLETSEPALDSALEERLQLARRRVEESPTGRINTPVLAAGAVLAVLGAGALGLDMMILGLLLLATGAVAVVAGLVRGGTASRLRAVEQLREAENSVGGQRHAAEEARRRLAAGQDGCHAHGLVTDPSALRSLALALSEAERSREDLRRWTEHYEVLAVQRGEAAALLSRALSEQGAVVGGDLRQALAQYVEACADRERVAEQASRHQALSEQLAIREETEKIAEGAKRARALATTTVQETAAKCGVHGGDIEELVHRLEEWQKIRSVALNEQQKMYEEWARLESLLDGRSIEELRAEAARQSETATSLAEEARGDPAVVVIETDVEAHLSRLRNFLGQVSDDAASLKGQVEEQARVLPIVPEAEEDLASAERELERVRQLDGTLEETLVFLERAQNKVHRDIAPVLAETVRSWLPKVTSGRYVDTRVDPETLAVKVRAEGGSWRDAARLSHGTAEQIYLLLRIAVAEHLTRLGETCPLILDDVTAQSDDERTVAILGMLHEISHTRQVILFSQEREVLEWGRKNLQGPQDRLALLDPEVIGA